MDTRMNKVQDMIDRIERITATMDSLQDEIARMQYLIDKANNLTQRLGLPGLPGTHNPPIPVQGQDK